jgi:hypothetical protein
MRLERIGLPGIAMAAMSANPVEQGDHQRLQTRCRR